MTVVRLRDSVTLLAPCLKGCTVPVGTNGIVVAVLRKLPYRIKVAWNNDSVTLLLVGLDDFTVKSECLECPACENVDPYYFSQDAATGIVQCDCGHEFDPARH